MNITTQELVQLTQLATMINGNIANASLQIHKNGQPLLAYHQDNCNEMLTCSDTMMAILEAIAKRTNQ